MPWDRTSPAPIPGRSIATPPGNRRYMPAPVTANVRSTSTLRCSARTSCAAWADSTNGFGAGPKTGISGTGSCATGTPWSTHADPPVCTAASRKAWPSPAPRGIWINRFSFSRQADERRGSTNVSWSTRTRRRRLRDASSRRAGSGASPRITACTWRRAATGTRPALPSRSGACRVRRGRCSSTWSNASRQDSGADSALTRAYLCPSPRPRRSARSPGPSPKRSGPPRQVLRERTRTTRRRSTACRCWPKALRARTRTTRRRSTARRCWPSPTSSSLRRRRPTCGAWSGSCGGFAPAAGTRWRSMPTTHAVTRAPPGPGSAPTFPWFPATTCGSGGCARPGCWCAGRSDR